MPIGLRVTVQFLTSSSLKNKKNRAEWQTKYARSVTVVLDSNRLAMRQA